MRYYVDDSSWFDAHPYNRPKIAKAVKAGGGANVRQSNKNGWSNLRAVVTFEATPAKLPSIQKSVGKALGTPWIIIHKKDW